MTDYYRLVDLARLFQVSQSAVSRWNKQDDFPKPDIVAGNVPMWHSSRDMRWEISEWRKNRPGKGWKRNKKEA